MADTTGTHPTPGRGERIPVEHAEPERHRLASAIKRVSWGAIIAGASIALVIQLGLGLLGLAIGLGAIDPATEANPLSGIGVGTGIWLAISTLIALFTGGYVAARMAGLPRRPDGILHGLVAWSLVTFLTFYLMTSAVGRVISGAAGVIGQGVDLLGQGVTAVGSQVAQNVNVPDVTLQEIKNEAAQLLRQTDTEALQPGNLEDDAQAAVNQAEDAVQTPSDARQELDGALDRLLSRAQNVVNAADREAAVNVLVERSDLSQAEAERTVDQYIQRAQQATQQVGQTAGQAAEQVQQTAISAADSVTAALSSAALWSFIAMALGALAAAFGGATGTPHDLPASSAVRRE